MITFKQMDALICIVRLGSFEAAAARLNMTQSAISKRIQEIEQSFDIAVFDRSSRSARLTEKGRELLRHCEEIVAQRNLLMEQLSEKKVLVSHLRLGVTELTAMTWLPELIAKIRRLYPRIHIEPVIEVTPLLFDMVINDRLDLIIAPDLYDDVRLTAVRLQSVENVWMCAPSLIPPGKQVSLEKARNYSFFVQGTKSGTGLIYERYFSSRGIKINKNIVCNNLVAQIGLTIGGLGITYLPLKPMLPTIAQGKLRTLDFKPPLPLVRYSAIYLSERKGLMPEIAALAESICHFDRFILS